MRARGGVWFARRDQIAPTGSTGSAAPSTRPGPTGSAPPSPRRRRGRAGWGRPRLPTWCLGAPDGALARERAQPLDLAVMADSPGDLLPGPRVLLGPGPTMADPRVLRAMATPLLGQFDPEFTEVMNEVMELSRVVFQTRNERAFPVPGTGRAGLEAAMVSLLEPGDRVVVGECGRFGLLMIEIAERCGADVVPMRAEWGQVIEPDAIARALAGGRTRMVAMIHGETSTGVLQPLAEIGRLARSHDALLMADAVVTLGGSEVATDLWGVDVMVAGTQKCLSCPSGLAPITYN